MSKSTPEFSRPVALDSLVPDRERVDNFTASDAECAALAKRFDIRSLSDFKGRLTALRVAEGKFIKISGAFEAEVVQACVVSLQDVPAHIQGEFETYFTEDGKEFDPYDDLGLEFEEEEDLHQVYNHGVLDLGELAAQYLSLELEPYPRAPGVSLAAQMAEAGAPGSPNPFQVLQSLKTDKEDKNK